MCGFHLIDASCRTLVVEGRAATVEEVMRSVPRARENDGVTRVLSNRDARFAARLYTRFNVDLKKVRLRAPLGALVERPDGSQALYLRQTEPARVGSAAWLATCRRLQLPDPPVDPYGPTLYTDWAEVGQWESAAAGKVTLLGYENATAWVHDLASKTATGFTAEGKQIQLPLF